MHVWRSENSLGIRSSPSTLLEPRSLLLFISASAHGSYSCYQAWLAKALTPGPSSQTLTLVLETESLTAPRAPGHPPPPPPLHSSHLALQFHTYTSMSRLHVSAEDLNSGPHADTAHTNHGAIAPTSSIGFKHYYLLRPPPQFLWHQAIRSSVLLYPEVVRGLLW